MTDGGAPAGRRGAKYARAWRGPPRSRPSQAGCGPPGGTPTPADRRLARLVAESPFRNIGPGVGYVGDAACMRCHADVASRTGRTPWAGRSRRPPRPPGHEPSPRRPGRRSTPPGITTPSSGGRAGSSTASRGSTAASPSPSVEAAVAYALGSGERGYSFLVERDGFVAQSPIAWYAQLGRHDLAPGYHDRNFHFERVILPECLSCHADGATPAGNAFNHYATPMELKPIGCERCHGPGALHVRRPGVGRGGFDPTIVNPRHLAPASRESVCDQCHLQGADRFLRAGHTEGDFRPGLPLDEFVAVFVEAGPAGRSRAVGQVEQLHASRCYAASGGALGCTSCHDPHRRPGPAERVEHYRGAASPATRPGPAASPSPTAAPARPTTVASNATCPDAGPQTSFTRR